MTLSLAMKNELNCDSFHKELLNSQYHIPKLLWLVYNIGDAHVGMLLLTRKADICSDLFALLQIAFSAILGLLIVLCKSYNKNPLYWFGKWKVSAPL
jgi:hypothetical protein